MVFEFSPHLHGTKGLAYFLCCFSGATPLLSAGRMPIPQKRIWLILLRLRGRRASPRCINTACCSIAERPQVHLSPIPGKTARGSICGGRYVQLKKGDRSGAQAVRDFARTGISAASSCFK